MTDIDPAVAELSIVWPEGSGIVESAEAGGTAVALPVGGAVRRVAGLAGDGFLGAAFFGAGAFLAGAGIFMPGMSCIEWSCAIAGEASAKTEAAASAPGRITPPLPSAAR
jgi:hypothetical protein